MKSGHLIPNNYSMLALYIVLGILGLLLIIFLVTLIVLHHVTFYTPIKTQNDDFHLTESTQFVGVEKDVYQLIVTLRQQQCEHVYTTSFDNLKLHARLYLNDKSNKVVLMFHGYRGTAIRDFSGGAMHMIKSGYNVLLVDERGHGESEGHNITFGAREKRDVLTWFDFAKKKFGEDKEYIFVGISMGAATILFASKYIDGHHKFICDCPYPTVREVLSSFIEKLNLPSKVFYPLLNVTSIIFSHTNLNQDNAYESVKKSNHKYLIIHGETDTVVPYKFSYRLYNENKEKVRYELFPNTDHGVSYLTDTPRYLKAIDDFLAE